MTNENLNPHLDPADAAVAARLARLRTRPVELSRLQNAVEAAVPRPRKETGRSWRLWVGGARGVAAAVLVASLVLVLVITSFTGPVHASPDRLAQLHQQVSGHGHDVHKVTSWDAAENVVEKEWPACPDLPKVPGQEVRCCCVQKLGIKKVACVSLVADGKPITMAIGNADDIKAPRDSGAKQGDYTVHSRDGINMVMTTSKGRWVCLMGELPVERLIEIAGNMDSPKGN